MPAPPPPPTVALPQPVGPATFVFDGQAIQGGWIRGQVPAGTRTARLGDDVLTIDGEGRFFAAFDRDAGPSAMLTATLRDGQVVRRPIPVAPREWQIERVDVARTPGGSSAAFLERRRPELAQIAAARARSNAVEGWRQSFIWPSAGRISGRFGSQRIYRGEPGSYHSGLDLAPGAGAPYVAPADGVVVLATDRPFSLEGNLLIVDHGAGLNSAFLHSQRLAVREGDRVAQGQLLGYVGSSGRATGPHLHWSLMWQGARLDPLLFLPPR
ncbi:peptidoglycan DD-metalloendopeptidase family protein [Altererythrobacter aerius]|uniref:Peptidoglycan DD-metalloendopeptidase family protein n=2 Tax=Tsuneonella aeria TaxID=1837929 RepID=A0A6I4TCT9_9SPHN|nr:M23 family metallopeptidase [Tsuneonella aeria]MXO75369.1 peptidoglycan DD-metalloendopeptidase family protein [Tsuneonella aeria]